MSEPADPVAELRSELADLRRELAEAKQAETPAEKREAREDVAEAEADVVAIARKAGLRPEQIQRALAAAKREAFMADHGEDIRAMVKQELDTLLEEAEAAEKEKESEAEPEAEEKQEKPKREPKQEPDEPPVHPHWSEKSVGDLIR